MKVYKYTVSQVTPRGKHINVFEKVAQSEMSYIELSDYLSDKYTGFVVSVEEINEIETIGSTTKRTYMSYEKMYEHCMKLDFRLDYSNDEDFRELIELNKNLCDLKQKFISKVYNEVIEDTKYKGIREKTIKVELTQGGYDKVTLNGEVMLKDLKLVQE